MGHSSGVPTVVHVREALHPGLIGLRAGWIRGHLERHAQGVIAICHDNLERLGLTSARATMIYNPVKTPECKGDYRGSIA